MAKNEVLKTINKNDAEAIENSLQKFEAVPKKEPNKEEAEKVAQLARKQQDIIRNKDRMPSIIKLCIRMTYQILPVRSQKMKVA